MRNVSRVTDIVGEVDGPEVAVTQQRGIACAH